MKLVEAGICGYVLLDRLADYTDNSHHHALKLTAELASDKIITTDEVLTEQVVQSVRGVLGSSSISVVPQSRRSFLPACELYEARADKGYSLTDGISMQTMEREGLQDVLTNGTRMVQIYRLRQRMIVGASPPETKLRPSFHVNRDGVTHLAVHCQDNVHIPAPGKTARDTNIRLIQLLRLWTEQHHGCAVQLCFIYPAKPRERRPFTE